MKIKPPFSHQDYMHKQFVEKNLAEKISEQAIKDEKTVNNFSKVCCATLIENSEIPDEYKEILTTNLQIKLVELVKKLFSTDSITKIESAINYEKFRKEKQTEEDEKNNGLSPFLNAECMKNN